MTIEFNKQFLAILQHTLGLDSWGKSKSPDRPEGYRNHFVASEGHHEWAALLALVEHKLMERHAPRAISGGSPWFSVTPEGRAYIAQHSPKPPKLTRSQERYRLFLRISDVSDMTFGEFVRDRWYLSTEDREKWLTQQSLKRLNERLKLEERIEQLREDLRKTQAELAHKWNTDGYQASETTGPA